MMFKEYLAQVIMGEDLSQEEAQQAMGHIMSGQASEAQIGSFLTALRMKGTSSVEIAGFAATMRQFSLPIRCLSDDLLDTCGTGGDGKGTFNISTVAAFVLAGAGVTVAKHGNRGLSSSCGSADVLTALGVKVDLPPSAVELTINALGIGFMYAPVFHQAMKYAAKPRKELGFRTVFNILGPLTNPAQASRQLIGVYERDLTVKVAEALADLGIRRAMVVHSFDGMDEISSTTPTEVAEVKEGKIKNYVIDPRDYGFVPCDQAEYRGGSPEDNARIARSILQGEKGPKRDIVLINAAAALVVAGKAGDLKEGLALAAASIDSGAGLAKLEALRDMTQRLAREGSLSS